MTDFSNILLSLKSVGTVNQNSKVSTYSRTKQNSNSSFKNILTNAVDKNIKKNNISKESKLIDKTDYNINRQCNKSDNIASQKEVENTNDDQELEVSKENDNELMKDDSDKIADEILQMINSLFNNADVSSGQESENLQEQVVQVLNLLSEQSPVLKEALLKKMDSKQLSQLSNLVDQIQNNLLTGNEDFLTMLSQNAGSLGRSYEALDDFKSLIGKMILSNNESEVAKGNTTLNDNKNIEARLAENEMVSDNKMVSISNNNQSNNSINSDQINSNIDYDNQSNINDNNQSNNSQDKEKDNKDNASGIKTEIKQSKLENSTHKIIQKVFQKVVSDDKVNLMNNDQNTKLINEVPEQASSQSVKHVPKAEVIKQIVEKAQVIIGNGASEMDMSLKPDNLGKLNLKVVIEKGLMTAKFVAESQQVKEIIESSFNELRDMLQQKGIEVQSLSVSVGQQGEGFRENQGFQAWREALKSNKSNSSRVDSDNSISDYNNNLVAANPYSYHDGNVDYRA